MVMLVMLIVVMVAIRMKGLGEVGARGQCGLIRRVEVTNVIISTNSIISIQIAAIYICVAIIAIIPILNYRHIECVFHLCGKSAEKNCHQLAAHLLLG